MKTKTYTVVEQVETVPLATVMALHDVLVKLTPAQRRNAVKAALIFAAT